MPGVESLPSAQCPLAQAGGKPAIRLAVLARSAHCSWGRLAVCVSCCGVASCPGQSALTIPFPSVVAAL